MNPYHTRPYSYNALHALDYILHYMPYVTIPYNTIPYNTIPYNTIPYNTIDYVHIYYQHISNPLDT